MPTKAKPTKGTLLQIGDGGGTEVFTTVGEVTNFQAPGESVEDIDVTSFDSTAREFISSQLVDVGEVTFDVNWVGSNTQQQQLRTDLRAGTLRNFKVILNDHATTKSTWAFAAIVKALPGAAGGQGEAYKISGITLRPSGLPTLTYAPA